MKRNSGFTLVELAIVVGIISVLAAIAIPNLLRARMNSNESAAISNLRTITSAEAQYRVSTGGYAGSFDELANPPQGPPFLQGNWDVEKNGYLYTLAPTATDFEATSSPAVVDKSGTRAFYVDGTSLIRWVAGAGPADANSTPLDEKPS